jgi:YD repeat-containing protein
VNYVYDTLNRLQTLTAPSAFGTGNFGFTYDALSRRTQLTRPNSVTTTYGYDDLSRLLNVTHKQAAYHPQAIVGQTDRRKRPGIFQ